VNGKRKLLKKDEIPRIVVTTSWDDGHPCDLKIANLLHEYGIKGTFYIPLKVPKLMEIKVMQEIAQIFEIGCHSRSHIDLLKASDKILKNEVQDSKDDLEEIIGKPVKMFCYPKGRYNSYVRKAVINAGFVGARTTKQFCLNIGNDPWLMPTTIIAYPFPSWLRVRHFIKTKNLNGIKELFSIGINKSWIQILNEFFYRALRDGGIFHLWGHSWEIEKFNLWDDLREVLKTIGRCPRVEYLTNGDVASDFHDIYHRPNLNIETTL
jgi:peptidoglycan-N-acetylglucosamine deacetylase